MKLRKNTMTTENQHVSQDASSGTGFGARIAAFLRSPWVIFGGCITGIVIGEFFHGLAMRLEVFGDLFFAFMMMCTLPIIISAVIGSLGHMFHAGHAAKQIVRMTCVFLAFLTLTAIIAYLTAAFIGPGDMLSADAKKLLGSKLAEHAHGLSAGLSADSSETASFNIWNEMIPSNVFNALGRGSILGVLVFSILIGSSIGMLRNEVSGQIILQAKTVFSACQRMIEWGMLAMPLGVCCFIAVQIAQTGHRVLWAVGGFFIVVHVAGIIIVLINNLFLARAAGVSYGRAFSAVRDALLVAFVTGNSFAPIPCALSGLQDNLKLSKSSTNIILPFGVTLCNPGAVIYIVAVSVFFCQLYDVSIFQDGHWLLIISGSVLASVGTAGGGPAVYGLLAILFTPMGLPLHVAIPLLLAVDQFTEPILTVVDIHMNCAISALLCDDD